jgi:hypothetical protein
MNKPELQQRIQDALPQMRDEDFDYHATDLYVRARPGLVRWLIQNYEFWTNVTRFTCKVNDPELQRLGVRELWLDIPFAGYWPNDKKVKKHEHN